MSDSPTPAPWQTEALRLAAERGLLPPPDTLGASGGWCAPFPEHLRTEFAELIDEQRRAWAAADDRVPGALPPVNAIPSPICATHRAAPRDTLGTELPPQLRPGSYFTTDDPDEPCRTAMRTASIVAMAKRLAEREGTDWRAYWVSTHPDREPVSVMDLIYAQAEQLRARLVDKARAAGAVAIGPVEFDSETRTDGSTVFSLSATIARPRHASPRHASPRPRGGEALGVDPAHPEAIVRARFMNPGEDS